jgi:23S rRNA pseudouridine1911/1915/1917 synthase
MSSSSSSSVPRPASAASAAAAAAALLKRLPTAGDSDSDSASDEDVFALTAAASTTARLDSRVAAQLACSRAVAQQLVRNGAVSVNGAAASKCSVKLHAVDSVSIDAAAAADITAQAALVAAQVAAPVADATVAFDVVHECDEFLVVNKPYDLTVHPALTGDAASHSHTLVNGLLHRYGAASLSRGSDAARPGIVHRLDRYTSGLMVVARTDAAHEHLAAQFARRTVDKRYQALVIGKPNSDDAQLAIGVERTSEWKRIERAIGHASDDTTRMQAASKDKKLKGAKHAITEYRVSKCWRVRNSSAFFSLLDVRLLTGRSHQIRVHLASIASPIVGDPIYSRQSNKQRVLTEESRTHLMLASTQLAFDHPVTGARMSFEAALPPHVQRLVQALDEKLDVVVAGAAPGAAAPTALAGPKQRIVVPPKATAPAPVARRKGKARGDDSETKLVDEDDISL